MTVACVLRSGGDFDATWVRSLYRAVAYHLPGARFVCLSDCPVPCERIPLEHNWPKWWAKLELFRLDFPWLYMDLDTLVVGNLARLASYAGDFAMISSLMQVGKRKNAPAQSGVMACNPGEASQHIWRTFTANPAGHMKNYRGDGEWLHAHSKPDRLQTLYPGQIVSLKREAKTGPTNGARLVCGHGKPRLNTGGAGWAHNVWKARAA